MELSKHETEDKKKWNPHSKQGYEGFFY
jgi:hypothetical protein